MVTVRTDLAKFRNLGHIFIDFRSSFWGSFSNWENINPTLAKFMFLGIFSLLLVKFWTNIWWWDTRSGFEPAWWYPLSYDVDLAANFSGTAIAQWIRLRLPFWGLGSNPKHTVYALINLYWFVIWGNDKKRPGLARFLKNKF